MSTLDGRVRRLEHALSPDDEDRPGWCCTVRDPEDPGALPARCPHGRRWLVMLTRPSQRPGLDARQRARQPHDARRCFTLRIDRARAFDVDEDLTDA